MEQITTARRYQSKYTCFQKFQHSKIASETKKTYTKYLKDFLKFCQFTEFEQLMEMSDSEKYESIMDYLLHLSVEKKLSHTTLMNAYSAIKKFFAINGIKLDWEQISNNCLGRKNGNSNGKIIEDRVYTKEEIIQLLDHADLRMKVIILTMLSSGIRVGGLADLKIKDLQYIEKFQIYKINVYSFDSKEKYVTYCTPECASIINKYLEYRKKIGDSIAPESPLIYLKTSKANGYKKERIEDHYFDKHISSDSMQQSVSRLQRKSQLIPKQSGEKDPTKRAQIRKPMMRCHAFRKIFDTICIENNVNHYVKEKLLGHTAKLGLDVNYFRPTESQLLNEYLKVVNDLTINDENRLSKQIKELQEKNQNKDYIIKGKLQEKEQEINDLKRSMEFLTNRFNAFLISQPENKIVYNEDNDDNNKNNNNTDPANMKGIELKSEINNKAVGKIIPSSSASSSGNKKK